MASLYILLPVALFFVAVAVALFLWAVRHRQFDDLEKEGRRILFDADKDNNPDLPGDDTQEKQPKAPVD